MQWSSAFLFAAANSYHAQVATEVSPPLPEDRVIHQRPFGLTGIDYDGPLVVKDGSAMSKVWIALFVCGTTRAIHLELVDSLSTEVFILAYRRFVARRGSPSLIRPDNATTFPAAADQLLVNWRFNPPPPPPVSAVAWRILRAIGRDSQGPIKEDFGQGSTAALWAWDGITWSWACSQLPSTHQCRRSKWRAAIDAGNVDRRSVEWCYCNRGARVVSLQQ